MILLEVPTIQEPRSWAVQRAGLAARFCSGIPAPCRRNHPMKIIGVLSHTQNPLDRPQRWISKNAKMALLRRLLAVELRRDLIQMLDPHKPARPATISCAPAPNTAYQHHIEPKIQPLTWRNSEWCAYMDGY